MYSDFEKDVIVLSAGRKTSQSERQPDIDADMSYPFVTVALETTSLPVGVGLAVLEFMVSAAIGAFPRGLRRMPSLKTLIIVHKTWIQRYANIFPVSNFMSRYHANIGGFRDTADKHLSNDGQPMMSKLPVFHHMTKADFEAACE